MNRTTYIILVVLIISSWFINTYFKIIDHVVMFFSVLILIEIVHKLRRKQIGVKARVWNFHPFSKRYWKELRRMYTDP